MWLRGTGILTQEVLSPPVPYNFNSFSSFFFPNCVSTTFDPYLLRWLQHSWDGRKKCRVGLLSPHLSQRSPPLFPLVLCDMNCFSKLSWSCWANTLVLAGSVLFLSHWGVEKTHHVQGWKTRSRSVLCWVWMIYQKEITAATSPATHWPFVRCNQLPR